MNLKKTHINILTRAVERDLSSGNNEHVRKLVRAGYLIEYPFGRNDTISHIISDAGRAALARALRESSEG